MIAGFVRLCPLVPTVTAVTNSYEPYESYGPYGVRLVRPVPNGPRSGDNPMTRRDRGTNGAFLVLARKKKLQGDEFCALRGEVLRRRVCPQTLAVLRGEDLRLAPK